METPEDSYKFGRRASDVVLGDLREEIRDLYGRSDTDMAFRAQAKVVGIIAMAIWAGSFFYTTLVKGDCNQALLHHAAMYDRHIAQLKTDDELQNSRLAKLESKQVEHDQRFSSLIAKMDMTNDRLAQIIEYLKKQGAEPRVF